MTNLVTLKHAAKVLSLTERTVWLYCSKKWIPSVRLGRVYRIREDTLQQIVSGELQIGPAGPAGEVVDPPAPQVE